MTSLRDAKFLAATIIVGLSSISVAEELKPSLARWAKSKCQDGISRAGSVCAAATTFASTPNARRLEEFARDSYFSLIELKEDFARNPAADEAPLAGENAKFYYDRGRVRAKQGEYDGAIHDMTACLRLAPKKAAAYCARGYLWGEKKEYKRGIRDLDRCIRIEPRFAEAYRARGAYWLTLDDPDRALADFNEFVRLDASARAYEWRAAGWIRKSEMAQAQYDFEQAVRLDSNDARLQFMLGTVRLCTGDDHGAVEALSRALELSPKSWEAYVRRCIAWARLRKDAMAALDAARALSLNPRSIKGDPPAPGCKVLFVARVDGQHVRYYLRWQNPKAGFAILDPRDFGAVSEGLDPDVRRRANELNVQAWRLATSRYEKLRDGVRAIETAREACEITEWRHAACLDTLAAAYAQCGDFESADKYQTLALEFWPPYLGGRRLGERRLERYRQRQPLGPQDTSSESSRSAEKHHAQASTTAHDSANQGQQQFDAYGGSLEANLPVERHFDAEDFKPKIKNDLLVSPPPQETSTATNAPDTNSSGNAFASASRGETRRANSQHSSTDRRAVAPWLSQSDFETVQDLNERAWLWATSRYRSGRDGVRAVEAAREACELTRWKDAACIDTLAAAYAECGDFESADKFQSLALEAWPQHLPGRQKAEGRWQRYRAHQPLEPIDVSIGNYQRPQAPLAQQPAAQQLAPAADPAGQTQQPGNADAANVNTGNSNAAATPQMTLPPKLPPISECPRVVAPRLSDDDRETVQAITHQAWLLATSRYESGRDGVRAVEAAREACEMTEWRVWGCVEALAAAYAECGDFESADKYQTLAEELAADGPPNIRHAAARRHALYRDRRPVHQGE